MTALVIFGDNDVQAFRILCNKNYSQYLMAVNMVRPSYHAKNIDLTKTANISFTVSSIFMVCILVWYLQYLSTNLFLLWNGFILLENLRLRFLKLSWNLFSFSFLLSILVSFFVFLRLWHFKIFIISFLLSDLVSWVQLILSTFRTRTKLIRKLLLLYIFIYDPTYFLLIRKITFFQYICFSIGIGSIITLNSSKF